MSTAEFKDKALPNVDTNHGGLNIINGNSHASLLEEQSAGPEPIKGSHTTGCDLEHLQRGQDSN